MAFDPNVLDDRRQRLARERADADRTYNDRLTTVDQTLPSPVDTVDAPVVDQSKLGDVNHAWRILPDAPLVDTADTSWKGRLRTFIWRLLGPPLTQQQHFNAALVDHLNRAAATEHALQATLADLQQRTQAHSLAQRRFQESLIHLLQAITAYVDTRDRQVGVTVEDELAPQISATRQALLSLKREIERAPARVEGGKPESPVEKEWSPVASATGTLASSTYLGFEDRFRGSQAEIRARVSDYVALFAGATNVLDVGCGRGEVLELFREAGIAAKGIDLNPSMIEVCRERGLEAVTADAVGYLQSQPDGSLGGLLAIQVVEHLDAAYLSRFLELAFHKLAPGAPIVLETINPTCWVAFFESYIRDMSHKWPLHPESLQFVVEAHGFSQVSVQFRSPVAEDGKLAKVAAAAGTINDPVVAELVRTLNAHADQLNARLYSFMDYAVLGQR